MALDSRWPLALFRGAAPIALGLMLWVAIAGGEQERQQTLKVRDTGAAVTPRGPEPAVTPPFFPVRQVQPDGNAAVLAERRRHNELVMMALREAAQTDDNVSQRQVPWRK